MDLKLCLCSLAALLAVAACDQMAIGNSASLNCRGILADRGLERTALSRSNIEEAKYLTMGQVFCSKDEVDKVGTCSLDNASIVTASSEDGVQFYFFYAVSPVAGPGRVFCEARGVDF